MGRENGMELMGIDGKERQRCRDRKLRWAVAVSGSQWQWQVSQLERLFIRKGGERALGYRTSTLSSITSY